MADYSWKDVRPLTENRKCWYVADMDAFSIYIRQLFLALRHFNSKITQINQAQPKLLNDVQIMSFQLPELTQPSPTSPA